MLFKVSQNRREETALRCVWMPANRGANAPLVAIWIETPCLSHGVPRELACNSMEGDSWACAA